MLENHRWDRPVASLNISGHPMTMAFHSYDKHLVIANEHDMIRYAPSFAMLTCFTYVL